MSPTHPHGHLVWRLSMQWRVAVDRSLAPLGLTHAQYVVLSSIAGLAPDRPSQRRLADHTGLEPLYISKLARGLEASGLITREPDPADTRAVRLALTGPGGEVTDRAVNVVRRLVTQLLEPLGGAGSARARQFHDDLSTLLAAPLDIAPAQPETRPEGARP